MPSRGHHNGRVMREWWGLPTASSARPFACEVGCQKEQDPPLLSDPQPRGSVGMGMSWRRRGTGAFQSSSLAGQRFQSGMASRWKIKTIKQKSIGGEPRGAQTSWGRKEDEGERWWLPPSSSTNKGFLLLCCLFSVLENISDFERGFQVPFQSPLSVNNWEWVSLQTGHVTANTICNAAPGGFVKERLCAFQRIFTNVLVSVVGFAHWVLMSYSFSASCLISKYH